MGKTVLQALGVARHHALGSVINVIGLAPPVAGHRANQRDGAVGSAVASFGFLRLPTVLMDMTLLTMAFDERTANIGVSESTLYFINTLGAATGAVLVPFYAAAAVNVAASGLGGRGGQSGGGAVCRAGSSMVVAHCCCHRQDHHRSAA